MTGRAETASDELAPPGALCALHSGRTAARICGRCGAFMCQGCSANGRERRCPRCRPAVSASVRAERHQNALHQSDVLTCRKCGYAGRKLDRFRGFKPVDILLVPALFALGFGIPIVFFLIRMATPMRPAWRCTTELRPEVEAPPASAEEVWVAAERIERRRIRRQTLGLGGAVL